jgi:pterin-4a-carbinolamine dehydratase
MPSPKASTPEEIQSALTHLPKWDVVERTPKDSDHPHVELHRLFEFASFPDALHFMLTAARFIQISDHHPAWQNTYSKVEVWITTGELKHKISVKDVTLAKYLEGLFKDYEPSS